MKLGMYTIEKTVYEGDVDKIIAKTELGEISILKDHIPLISRLVKAPLVVVEHGGEEKKFDINSGFIEVQPENSVVVLIDID